MKKHTRVIASGALATAVIAALSAFASNYSGTLGNVSGATASVAASSTVSAATAAAATGRKQLPSGVAEQASFDRFIIKFQDGSAAQRSQTTLLNAVNSAVGRAGVASLRSAANGTQSALTPRHLRRMSQGADVIRFSHALSHTEAQALLQELRKDPSVVYAQPDYLKHAMSTTDDPELSRMWHFNNPTTGIRAPLAWDTSKGAGVLVAVLDTGYLDHRDLDANIVAGYDFIGSYGQSADYPDVAGDGDGRDADAHDPGDWTDASMPWCGRNSDSSFHGTHVAGTVAAVGNNTTDVVGVAYEAKVQPVRVLGHCGGFTSDIADAITWASGGAVAGAPDNSSNHAEVLNLSLGGGGSCANDQVTQAAIDGAISRGVTVVVAAGNNNADAANFSPASCKGVITVGANGVDGARSWFSNYGPTVTVTAPGGNANSGTSPDDAWIWSLGNTGTKAPVASPAGDAVVPNIGTSMASPHVAGIVALMQSAAVASGNPPLTPAQVRTILRRTAKPFSVAPPTSMSMGAGIVDAAAAVAAASQPIPEDTSVLLDNRKAVANQAGGAGEGLVYSIVVPAGTSSLNLRSYGGTGDVSLYVSYEAQPTTVLYDRKSAKPGNSEAVVITNPQPGTYYLRMVGEKAFTAVSVMGLYQ
ncbi:S8 family peptidase [Stenotrophomonas sp. SY1]|uniref:S8 family peptidase n=1 Tax=Stenotrophomonas sp. SY1 TaxID=477235 RepID=UPI001E612117|nr:S8 family peptidase [Stenotrophomonas sp. SY1]MCD9086243.1 S8 family serine peptidase [Stenotrophomonas sp. SY1]